MIDNNVVARRPAPALHAVTVQRLTGTRAEVTAALRQYRAAGQLSEVGKPCAVPGHPGVIRVDARLVAVPSVPASGRRWPYIVAAIVAALAALGWALYAVASTVVASSGGILAALVIGVLFVLVTRASRRGRGCTTTVHVTHHH